MADSMTILGLDQQIYEAYVENVRLEYGNTPQFDMDRKRILQYFLKMDRIYKTDFSISCMSDETRLTRMMLQ